MSGSLGQTVWWLGSVVLIGAAVVSSGFEPRSHVVHAGEPPEFVGVTVASREARIGCAQAGRLGAVLVREGDRVVAGQELFRLEDDVEKLDVQRLELLTESTARLDLAEARFVGLKAIANRLTDLSDRKIASPARRDEAETNLRVAQAELASERELATLRKIELDQARARLELRRARCPFDGVVEAVDHSVGEALDQLEPVLHLLALDPLLVEFPCPVERLAEWSVGTPVTVDSRDRNGTRGEARDGQVVFRGRQVDIASQTVLVRVRLANPERDWLSGRKVSISRKL